MKNLIVLPMAFYVFYVFCLLLVNFRVRVGAIRAKEMRRSFFMTYAGEAPDRVIVAGRHFDNQFQLPTYFLAACCAHLTLGQVTMLTLILAWVFVASRIAHSFVHLGANHILKRMSTYFVGWLAVLALFGQLAYFALAL